MKPRELERPFADKQAVVGPLHHQPGDGGGMDDVSERGHAASGVGRPVHHGGVELDDPFLVGQPAETHRVVGRIGLDDRHAFDRGVHRVVAGVHQLDRLGHGFQAVGARDRDRPAVSDRSSRRGPQQPGGAEPGNPGGQEVPSMQIPGHGLCSRKGPRGAATARDPRPASITTGSRRGQRSAPRTCSDPVDPANLRRVAGRLSVAPIIDASTNLKNQEIAMAETRKGEVTMKGNPVELVGPKLTAGQQAPDFACADEGLGVVKLSDTAGKARLFSVVPSLDTPVCSNQTRTFAKQLEGLGDKVAAYTISLDLPFAMKRFCAEADIENIKNLTDAHDQSFGKAYGVLISSLPIPLLARAIFVLDPSGKLTYVEYVPEIGSEPKYDEAMTALKAAAGA